MDLAPMTALRWYQKIYLQDAVDARRHSIEETKKKITDKANAIITWNYEVCRDVCEAAPGGQLPERQAFAAAEQIDYEVSRANNRQAIECLYPYLSAKKGQIYPVPKEHFVVAPELSFPVKLLGLLHTGVEGTLIWVQFRKNPGKLLDRLGVVASAIQSNYLDDPEYSEFDLELLDVSADDSGNRKLDRYTRDDLELLSDSELADFFDPVSKAIAEMRAANFEPNKRPKSKRPRDTSTIDLFGR